MFLYTFWYLQKVKRIWKIMTSAILFIFLIADNIAILFCQKVGQLVLLLQNVLLVLVTNDSVTYVR